MDEWEARMRKATTDPRLPPTVRKDFVSALECIDALREALAASQTWLYGHHNAEGQEERRRLNDEVLKT